MGYRTRWSPLKISDVAIPDEIKPTQLVIKLTHIGLNPIDIKLKSIALLPLHYTIGKDFSGTVEVVGSGLDDQYTVGERVCGGLLSPLEGFVGTRALLDVTKHAVLKPPASLSDAQCAAFPLTFGTAWEMLQRTKGLGPDAAVLVLGGATNVGAYAIQILRKYFGVSNITATCGLASSDFVKVLGAKTTIDYRAGDVGAQLLASVPPQKYQAIVDTVGGYDALRIWPDLLAPYSNGSVYVTIAGDAPPRKTYAKSLIRPTIISAPWVLTRLLLGKQLGINYQVATAKGTDWVPAAEKFFMDDSVQIPIDSITPLEDFEVAWDKLNHIGARGKVLIRVG